MNIIPGDMTHIYETKKVGIERCDHRPVALYQGVMKAKKNLNVILCFGGK